MTTPKDFQQSLKNAGFDPADIDGLWGPMTENAVHNWFLDGRGIEMLHSAEPVEPPSVATVVPSDWMPDCDMDKVICHWTAGSYEASENDKEHYHILVDGNCRLVRGEYSIKANVSTSDSDGYAAHTKNLNTKTIGISACCMAGAVENPFNPGKYPLGGDQWDMLARVAADLCRFYEIKVSPTTVLQHGEVQSNLGVAQSGKWDICRLPWETWDKTKVGNDFRSRVSAYLDA